MKTKSKVRDLTEQNKNLTELNTNCTIVFFNYAKLANFNRTPIALQ